MTYLDVLGKRILFLGKTGSGKSQLVRYILTENIHEFSKVFVICPTERINKFYSRLVPSENIFDEYNEEWMDKLLKKLSNMAESGKELQPILLILDDIGAENDVKNSKALQRIMCRGRHLKINCWQIFQYMMMCPTISRNQFDLVMCGQGNKQSLEILSDSYLFGDITRKEFQTLYHQNTRDYNFFVINTSSVKNSDDLNEIYSSIRTPPEYL
jgi:Cdc6-like AAA superfamily ATPase